MPSANNVLDQARQLIRKRIAELDDERKQLERAVLELGGRVAGRPGRPPRHPATSGSKAPPRRRRKGGRAAAAVKLVKSNPGITASEIAKQLKIKPNYVYRVLGNLEKEGRVKKEGRKYQPVG